MLSVVCWKWNKEGYRSKFNAESVNILHSMLKRNLTIPFRLICITDDPAGINSDIQTVKLWENPYPTYGRPDRPNCFARLKAFSREFTSIAGPRFVSMDLDCVIVDNIDSVFNRPEDDFIIWKSNHPKNYYNGSLWMMDTGCRSQVWTTFDRENSHRSAREKGFFGSDQSHICNVLGPREKTWDIEDGVYSYRIDCKPRGKVLPEKAKIVLFHGPDDPWSDKFNDTEWIRRCYQ